MVRQNVNPNLTPSTPTPPLAKFFYLDTRQRCERERLIESPGGVFWTAENWEVDNLKAITATAVRCGFYGQRRDDILASMYRAGLHLPVESQADWTLMASALRVPSAPELFIQNLKAIAPRKAAEYEVPA